MISSFRNFAKTKFAGLLVFIMIIPFVFWGMGSMFSSGNTNNIAKINKKNISTQDFIDYLNNTNIPQEYIRENLDNNIIQELLAGLISSTLIDLEIQDFKIIISENTLLKKIKKNKNFQNKNGNFERTKYEKFLLENNQSAAGFEQRLKKRETQKNLFDYIGAGIIAPEFLTKKLFEEENRKLEIEYINLSNFYKKKDAITEQDLKSFVSENIEKLKSDYIDFDYTIINPQNLIGVSEFNQTYFDKIDKIEIDISNEVGYRTIVSNLNLVSTSVTNYRFLQNETNIKNKIFELKDNDIDIFENGDEYVLFKIRKIVQKEPNLNEAETRNEIIKLVTQKNKFIYNQKLLEKIRNKEFKNNNFLEMGKDKIEKTKLNSIKDNNKFDINAVKILYSLPINSFTLINDEKDNIYLAKINKIENKFINKTNNQFKDYVDKENSLNKNSLLKSYDFYLNDKYKIDLNQKTIDRVGNFFQ